MTERRRLYTEVYGLVSKDGATQTVANLPRGTVFTVDPRERLVEASDGRRFRLDKARFRDVLRSSVPLEQ